MGQREFLNQEHRLAYPEENAQGSYAYSYDDENFNGNFDSLEEMAEEMYEEVMDEQIAAIGKIAGPWQWVVDGESIIENAIEFASDHVGDVAYDVTDVPAGLAEELEKLVEKFLNEKWPAKFWSVERCGEKEWNEFYDICRSLAEADDKQTPE